MNIHYVQHVPFETLALVGEWAHERRHTVSCTRLFAHEALPPGDTFDWLFIMGGPMSIHEERKYPWLTQEKTFIKNAIASGRRVIGICLGAQLIADVLGGQVTKNPEKERGWFPVTFTEAAFRTNTGSQAPAHCMAFHWHSETFSIPPECIHFATSTGCTNQALSYDQDRVIGLQFHLELDGAAIEQLIIHCHDRLEKGPFIQDAETMRAQYAHIQENKTFLFRFLDMLEERDRVALRTHSGGEG